MHPILGRPERIALYLTVWLIIGGLLAGVLTRQGLSWPQALVLLLPILLVYAFVCLSAWYVCRALPLRSDGLLRALAASLVAAGMAGSVFLGLAQGWIAGLATQPFVATPVETYRGQMPFLFAAGVLLFLLALAVHYALLAFEAAQEAERQRLELEVLTRDAELRALRAQIDPHFLYNSLNSISAMTTKDPAGARRMCVMLGEFLRNTLDVGARQWISLADELALADGFLGIEQVRFGDRLQVSRRVDESATRCLVPPLLLQPLVENAVNHGIARLLDGGVIQLDIARGNGRLRIAIENPRDEDDAVPAHRGARHGVGLSNVRRRLEALFGSEARLDARAEGGRFRVQIDLPWATDD
jgi:hypothetical protein